MEEELDLLFNFWLNNSFTQEILQHSPLQILKSLTESISNFWILLINHFHTKEIRDENIENLLFYIFSFTFESYGNHLFNHETFDSFKTLIENRSKIYPEILKNFINPKEFETESYNKLYTLIIEKPMQEKLNFEIDFLKWAEVERISNVQSFIGYYYKIVGKYLSKINEIW